MILKKHLLVTVHKKIHFRRRRKIFTVRNHEVEIPVKVFVAAQVLQFHGLDLVVVQVKLMETVWEI